MWLVTTNTAGSNKLICYLLNTDKEVYCQYYQEMYYIGLMPEQNRALLTISKENFVSCVKINKQGVDIMKQANADIVTVQI